MKKKDEILNILTQIIVPSLFMGTLATAFLVAPGFVFGFKYLLSLINEKSKRKRELRPSELRKIFMNMKRKELIDYKELPNGNIKIKILRNGLKKVLINNLDKVQFKIPQKWDKKFYIVIFDIPNKYKVQRDYFVRKLKELNFYQLQKSVYVFIHPPQEIVDFLSHVLDIAPYVRILEALKIEGEKEILVHFNIKN